MDGDTKLVISYAELKDMLNEFQMDGINADGCTCGLHLDEDEEIAYGIKHGYIRVSDER